MLNCTALEISTANKNYKNILLKLFLGGGCSQALRCYIWCASDVKMPIFVIIYEHDTIYSQLSCEKKLKARAFNK